MIDNLLTICYVLSDDDDEYDGGYEEPVVMTASGDHHQGDAFDDADEGFTGEHEPHVGIVHSNGDGWCQPCSSACIAQ